MEEILKQILTELKGLNEDVNGLKEGQNRIEGRLSNLEVGQDKILDEVNSIYARQGTNHLESLNKFNETNNKIDSVQVDVNNVSIKASQSDNKIIEINRKLSIVK